jgi:hypothetical protein
MLVQSIGESVVISEIIIRLESEPKIGDELSKLVSGPSCRIDCIGKKGFNGNIKGNDEPDSREVDSRGVKEEMVGLEAPWYLDWVGQSSPTTAMEGLTWQE